VPFVDVAFAGVADFELVDAEDEPEVPAGIKLDIRFAGLEAPVGVVLDFAVAVLVVAGFAVALLAAAS